jgi:beta-lactamase class A
MHHDPLMMRIRYFSPLHFRKTNLNTRRVVSSFGALALLGGFGVSALAASPGQQRRVASANTRLRELEAAAQGRLGVHIIDTATGQEYGYRADERFMMLSTFKLLACAVVLSRVDAGNESLDRRIIYSKQDLVTYSPVTEKHAGGEGMTLAQLCEATLTTSDNTAANLILASYGGPAALTALARKLGDRVTRLDRTEPELNVKHPDNLMDTTSPRAMALTMQKVVLGNALSPPSRELLQQWLLANTTGGKRLKSGLPPDWQIGDKTGTNKTDTNDIGVVWPPNRMPWLVTAYLADSQVDSEVREATMAHVGALVRQLAV